MKTYTFDDPHILISLEISDFPILGKFPHSLTFELIRPSNIYF